MLREHLEPFEKRVEVGFCLRFSELLDSAAVNADQVGLSIFREPIVSHDGSLPWPPCGFRPGLDQ